MATFTVQEIVRATQGALVVGDLGVPVTGVSIDSRTLGVGEAFFAIVGHRLDGHDFIADAASRGAACVVAQNVPDHIPAGVPFVLVEDTTRALGRLAARHRAKFALPLVAVTGSNGKTTTKEMMAAVLAARGKVLKPEGSFNNQWGVPLTLLRLTSEHQALVVEIGCNQRGEIGYLAGLAAPTVGVVTTVAETHLERLGSIEGVREEKAALVRAIGADGVVALNADDPRVAGMAHDTRARVITYGCSETAEVRAAGGGACAWPSRAGTTSPTRWPPRRPGSRSGCRWPTSPPASSARGRPRAAASGARWPACASSTTATTPTRPRCARRSTPRPPTWGRAAWSSRSATCSSWGLTPRRPTPSWAARSRRAGPPSSSGSARTCSSRWRRPARR